MSLLLEDGNFVPLKSVVVDATVVDLVATVVVEHVFEQPAGHSLEAIYKFPLDDAASVFAFEANVDDQLVKGVVEEKEQAKARYSTALQRGSFAALVEDDATDVFSIRLGHFKSRAVVRLSFVALLKYESCRAVFFIPTTIAPRYNAQGILFENFVVEKTDYVVSVRLDCAGALVTSPSHSFNVVDGKVSLKSAYMDRDIIFYIDLKSNADAIAVYQRLQNGFVAMITHYPDVARVQKHKAELIFLIDRSGSMHGKAIEQAKEAMEMILHSIPKDSYFNIVGFGTRFEQLFEKSCLYSEETLKQAKECINALDARMGGTEIYNPLKHVLERETLPGYQKQIFVMTDGEVSNVDAIINLLKKYEKTCRVFSLGLGSSACHHLINSMARVGNGTAMYANFNEKLEKKILHQLDLSLRPSVSGIEFGGNATMFVPTKPDPVFKDECIVSFCYFDSLPQVTLNGKIVEMRLINADGSLHRLATKRLIQDMQDGPQDSRETIVKLALDCGIASRYTSFVAVGETIGDAILPTPFRISNQIAYGYGGGMASSAGRCVVDSGPDCAGSASVVVDLKNIECFGTCSVVENKSTLVRRLVKSQKFDGSFVLDKVLAEEIGCGQECCQTAFVVDYLERYCLDEIDVWRLVVDKAKDYLSVSRVV